MDITEEELKDFRDLLSAYFDNDPQRRFKLERLIGTGGSALAWRLRYTDGESTKRLVLKHDRFATEFEAWAEESADAEAYEPDPDNPHTNERHWLSLLQWAEHVVRIYSIPDDPLARLLPLKPHHMEDWNFLEWIENGSVGTFMKRAVNAGYPTLPNRLLWGFFLCLIRMCIAMGWPPRPLNGFPCLEHIGPGEPGRLVHGDMHNDNLMIGEDPLSIEEEHFISPPLKMIDLASACNVPMDSPDDPVKENIWAIGKIMCQLVILSFEAWNPEYADPDTTVDFQPSVNGPILKTAAVGLLPDQQGHDPAPFLDRDLRTLLCKCLAQREENRPSLAVLAYFAMDAIRRRDSTWYQREGSGHRYPAMEEDEFIETLLQTCLRNAPPS